MMRSFFLFSLLAFFTSAYALPLGNPADPYLLESGVVFRSEWSLPYDPCALWYGDCSLRLGFYGNYVFERYMQVIKQKEEDMDGIATILVDDSDIQRTSLYTNAALINLNLWGRFDLYAVAGATNIFIRTPGTSFSNPFNGYVSIESETDVSWGVGGRVTLWGFGPFSVGAEAQAFYCQPQIDYVYEEGVDPIYLTDDDKIYYGEWQMGLGISYDIYLFECSHKLVPYAGIKWSEARFNMDEVRAGLNILHKLESKKNFGYSIGATVVGSNCVSLAAEASFGDEKALYISGQIRF